MITEKQKQKRKQYIGASDVPAIIGVDPYTTAYQIWLEKTGQFERDIDPESPWLLSGKYVEDAVLNWAERHLGKISRKNLERRIKGTPVLVHLDGLTKDGGYPVECKTAALHGPLIEFYGEEWTDQLPERVLVQCQMQMEAVDRDRCYVPVFIGGRGFVMYVVERDMELVSLCLSKVRRFWEHHVKHKIPPEEPAPVKLAKYVKRTAGKSVELPQALVDEWLQAKAELSYVKEHVEGIQENIHKILIEAEAEIGLAEKGQITYLASERKMLDSKRLKQEHPEIVEQYTKTSMSRTLRWKPYK